MENGSKALLIAGAILLAILIIGLGVFIYNQASNTVGETGMDQVAIRQFNGQFEPYINKTIDSTAAKALIDTVNQTENNRVVLDGITNKNSVKTGHKYTVEPRYTNGLITGIIIRDENGTTVTASEEDIIRFNNQFSFYIVVPDINRIKPGAITASRALHGPDAIDLVNLIESVNSHSKRYITLNAPKDMYTYCDYEASAVYGEDKYLSTVIIDNIGCGDPDPGDDVIKR